MYKYTYTQTYSYSSEILKPKKATDVAEQISILYLIFDQNPPPSPRTPLKPSRTKPLTPLHPGDLPYKKSPMGGAPLPGRGGAQGRKDGGAAPGQGRRPGAQGRGARGRSAGEGNESKIAKAHDLQACRKPKRTKTEKGERTFSETKIPKEASIVQNPLLRVTTTPPVPQSLRPSRSALTRFKQVLCSLGTLLFELAV